MKINIFYLLSKISLILLSLIAIFAIFSSFQDNISINLLYVTVAIIHAGLILQIKKLNRPIRFLFVIVVTPLLSYLLLNYTYILIVSNNFQLINSIITNLIEKIILITYYFIPSFFIMILYKYEVLTLNNQKEITVPEIITFIFQFLLFAIPAFLVLSFVFSFELTSILAAGGIVFAAIALSLQSSLSDLIKGIFVNIDKHFSISHLYQIDKNEN